MSRLSWIDYARGIAIFLVLYRHIFEGIKRSGLDVSGHKFMEEANLAFFSFRMPLFFIISGVFIGGTLLKRGLNGFVINKWRLLLYPYLVWTVIQITIQMILSNYVNAERTYWDYLYIFYRPREIDQFWYLYALFNTSVLFAFTTVKFKIPGSYQLVIGLLMFLLSSYLVQRKIYLGFIYDILHFYVFVALGSLVSGFILDKKRYQLFSSWKLFFIILPFFVACQWYFLVTNVNHNMYGYVEDFQPLLFLVIALSGVMFMINISFIFQRYNAIPLLRIIGFHSLFIYLMHVLAASATRIFMVKVLHVTNVPVLMITLILAGLFIPIIIYNLAIRWNAWWLFSPVKPDYKPRLDKKVLVEEA